MITIYPQTDSVGLAASAQTEQGGQQQLGLVIYPRVLARGISAYSEVWYRVRFGIGRSQVQILLR